MSRVGEGYSYRIPNRQIFAYFLTAGTSTIEVQLSCMRRRVLSKISKRQNFRYTRIETIKKEVTEDHYSRIGERRSSLAITSHT